MNKDNNKPLFLRYKKYTILVSLMVIADLVLYFFGIFAPFMTLEKFFIFDQKLSLLESIHVLYNSKEYVLAAIVGGFSVVFPIIKLLLLTLIWFLLRDEDKITKWILRIEVVGNWSMLDVFVVAITVVVIKLSGLGKIEVHYGLYLFAASVILTKLSLLIIHGLFIPKKNLKIKNLKIKNNKQKKTSKNK